MFVLRSSPPSPFGRKVKIAAAVLGLGDRISVAPADTNDPGDLLRRQNPLGKIPTLVLEDGSALYDSPVIIEYLDCLAGGGKIIPRRPGRASAALTLQALADGLVGRRAPANLRDAVSRRRANSRQSGSTIRPARSRARWRLWKRRPRRRKLARRRDRRRLRSGLSRSALRGPLARRTSPAGGLARGFCRARASLRGNARRPDLSPKKPGGSRRRASRDRVRSYYQKR